MAIAHFRRADVLGAATIFPMDSDRALLVDRRNDAESADTLSPATSAVFARSAERRLRSHDPQGRDRDADAGSPRQRDRLVR